MAVFFVQVCATVYHYVHGRKVDKMCMDEQACTAATNNNSETCVSGIAEPKCTYCCENPLCNYHKSVPSNAYGVCNSTDYCKNGGVCYDHEDFGLRCQCRVGFHGSQCEFEGCTRNPCQNGGWCQKEEVPDLKECDEAMEQKISSDNGLCGLIFNPTQPNNPFANCLASPLLNGDAFAENCLFDVCALQDEVDAAKQAACGSLEALTAQCKSLGIIIDWREAAQCHSDPCWSEPCLNGGTCVTFSMNAYNCSCPEDFEGHDCEDEVWYEFGSWSNWTCIDDGMIRYRECFKYPKQVQVENELCSGESHETKDIELDCLKCLEDGGWASHECNKQIFWRCYGTVENCIAEKMNCPACTKWSQELLTCVHDDEPCVRPTTTTSRPTTTQANTAAPGDECRNDDGSIFEAVPGDPSKYKWILTDGRVFEMPCPPGTSFVLAACGCIVV
ncbi:hypothetical protein CAPTEDRAFT_225255 [Capitella teleta]|uniref:EGF-like domain-containing protein n=1 Tax=Capitella teleta TaxID=283909 RepID=R7V8B4_CAPTE|nr:hypothetical protein CAPTEDRAFT_225255 [Capitella teleta]|eukprot:ELU12005.1 hypothetical protein CAPTEDRAFT_225255 [Capitella teleta]